MTKKRKETKREKILTQEIRYAIKAERKAERNEIEEHRNKYIHIRKNIIKSIGILIAILAIGTTTTWITIKGMETLLTLQEIECEAEEGTLKITTNSEEVCGKKEGIKIPMMASITTLITTIITGIITLLGVLFALSGVWIEEE